MRILGRLFGALLTSLLIGSVLAAPASAVAPAPASVSTATSTSAAGGLSVLAAARPAKVTVPANYVYDPKLGVRHDYCSYAPDEFPAPFAANADFRGPCARHDLCYDGDATKRSCDRALRRNMFRNCDYYYGRYNPLRAACRAAALTYWAAVVA